MAPKPSSIIAHVPGSGTAATSGPVIAAPAVMPVLIWLSNAKLRVPSPFNRANPKKESAPTVVRSAKSPGVRLNGIGVRSVKAANNGNKLPSIKTLETGEEKAGLKGNNEKAAECRSLCSSTSLHRKRIGVEHRCGERDATGKPTSSQAIRPRH